MEQPAKFILDIIMVHERVAVKQLKSYSPHLAPTFVKAYEPLFNLNHNNIVRVVGLCPQEGAVVLEYCEKRLGEF